MPRNNWSREQLIIAFYLYCKIPFGTIHTRNPKVIEAAKAIGRTPSAVAWKLANFASLDPSLKSRRIKGASHVSSLDREVSDEFYGDWTGLVLEAEKLVTARVGRVPDHNEDILLPEGKTRSSVTEIRIGQAFFRSAVLAAYDSRCCITGLPISSLLVASHIAPWSVDLTNRTNPRNGLCLNALHDRAFDCGLLTITPEYRVRVSPVAAGLNDDCVRVLLSDYDGKAIHLPGRFLPERDLLDYHNQHVFLRDTSEESCTEILSRDLGSGIFRERE